MLIEALRKVEPYRGFRKSFFASKNLGAQVAAQTPEKSIKQFQRENLVNLTFRLNKNNNDWPL